MYQADSSCFSRPSSYGLSLQIRNGTCTPPLLLKQSAYHVCLFVCLLHNIFVPLCAARCGGVRTEMKWNTASNPKWMKKYLNINIKIWISLLYYPVMEFKNGKMACCLLPPPKGKTPVGLSEVGFSAYSLLYSFCYILKFNYSPSYCLQN